jgi:hypothetical protein
MTARKATDEEIEEAYKATGGQIQEVARLLKMSVGVLHGRIAKIEREKGHQIRTGKGSKVRINRDTRPNPIELQDGVIVVASDCHYWPGEPSPAHRGLLKVIKSLKPEFVIINGDEFDGASVSRHGRIGWEARPTVAQEMEALSDRMGEIAVAARGAHLLGSYGNHTMRWDTLMAAQVPQAEGVKGLKFDDLLTGWNYAWAWMVNGHTLIKHRIKGGIHATWNNTADAQISTVTGHLHNLRCTPRSTMSPVNGGTIYGIDCGMVADPWSQAFGYMEQGPRNWRAGFAVLTFRAGILMPPDLAQVVDDETLWFRGRAISV